MANMIMEVWFPDTETTGKIMGKATGNTVRVCPITHSMPRGKGITNSSPHSTNRGSTNRGSTSRGKKGTGTIRDTAVIKAMDLDLHRNTIITRVTGQEEALQTLHISSNKHHRAAELDSLPNIKLLDRSSSVLL